jgi:type I restriction-modification system DNA methylase subunit
MSLSEDFISKVCNAFKEAYESGSGVTLEGREREFRRVLARYLFDEALDWEGHSKIGEIYDITCFDDENFPIIDVETKWGVEPTPEIKEKLRKRIEELGSVKYGVFASERDFIAYEYADYKLREITKINVAEATGVARGEYELSEDGKKRILKLEMLKRERLVWIEDPDYFEKTSKEVSVAKGEGVKLLTENLKEIVNDLSTVSMNFFDSYLKRREHYSGRFLENTFNDWLKISMKDDEFERGDETKRRNLIEVFCRETAYVLIGRVLFIRICEDKDIIKTMISAKGIAESLRYYGERSVENVYLRLFNESREEIKKYYSHLHELGFFDWWVIEEVRKGTFLYDDMRIQDSLERDLDYSIKKALRRLNRFDFTQINRDILGDVYQGYLPKEERKRLGEFYTPTEIVKYILDAVGYKPENEIRGKKIVDPACGSGSFLVEATQRLIERYRRIGFNLKDSDDAKQITDGCINSIYGLDIHPFACFIAEMNLLFQLVDLYDVVKRKHKYFELPRLNIYRTDSLAPVGEPIELTKFFDNSRRKMLIEETKEADKVKDTTFDFVVGNPPYVRKERIPTDYKKKILIKTYPEVYHGDNDIYVYFISKGINWLNEHGKFGFIVSGKFMKTRYGEGLRAFIADKCCIEQLFYFGDIEVFKEVTNYPNIIILEKETDAHVREEHAVKTVTIRPTKKTPTELMKLVRSKISESRYIDDHISVFVMPQTSLTKARWKLIPLEANEIFEKIKRNSTCLLEDLCDVYYGIKTGNNRVFVVNEKTVDELGLERDLLKPVLEGEDIRRYNIKYREKFLVFPYVKEEKEYKVVDIEKFPNLNRYLNQYTEDLANRYDIKYSKSKWFELRQCDYYNVFESSKIITPKMGEMNSFGYDSGVYFCLDSCFVITLKEDRKNNEFLKYLLGVLNSKVLEFYFKQISTFVRDRWYIYHSQYLVQLPIIDVDNRTTKPLANQIVQKVDEALKFNAQTESINKKLKTFPQYYFKDVWRFDKLADVIKTQSISRESYTISEKLPRTDYLLRDLDGKETFRITLAPNEYVDFYSEEVASYVFEVLKRMHGITKRELLEFKIPAEPHLKNLMSQYLKDKEQIVKNEKAVKELEKQIDDLVYKLYDITYAERRIIEDYLKKF